MQFVGDIINFNVKLHIIIKSHKTKMKNNTGKVSFK